MSQNIFQAGISLDRSLKSLDTPGIEYPFSAPSAPVSARSDMESFVCVTALLTRLGTLIRNS